MLGHPARHELAAYAESLVDKHATVSAKTSRHVAGCRLCTAEVRAIRESLAFVAQAAPLEPPPDFTEQILRAARGERKTLRVARNRRRSVTLLIRGLAYAAGVAVVATVSFTAALKGAAPTGSVSSVSAAREPSPKALRKATEEIRTLAVAFNYPSSKPLTLREREHQRRLVALKSDIAEATAALEQNPGCARASYLLETNIQRQAQALKTLYVERTL